MPIDQITVSVTNGRADIRLNRPEKKNAITIAMYRSLAAALKQADHDPAVRVITLSAGGDAFCAGNDLVDFLENPITGADHPVGHFISSLAELSKPIIAGVNGLAVGIGATMLLHCDLVYAVEQASFRFPFVDLGLLPEAGSSLILPRLIGRQRAAELLMLGKPLDAATAQELGLVNAICAPEVLEGKIQSQAALLAAKPPAALRLTKRLLKSDPAELSVRIAEELSLVAQQLESAEAREAIEALIQKRKPDFSRFS